MEEFVCSDMSLMSPKTAEKSVKDKENAAVSTPQSILRQERNRKPLEHLDLEELHKSPHRPVANGAGQPDESYSEGPFRRKRKSVNKRRVSFAAMPEVREFIKDDAYRSSQEGKGGGRSAGNCKAETETFLNAPQHLSFVKGSDVSAASPAAAAAGSTTPRVNTEDSHSKISPLSPMDKFLNRGGELNPRRPVELRDIIKFGTNSGTDGEVQSPDDMQLDMSNTVMLDSHTMSALVPTLWERWNEGLKLSQEVFDYDKATPGFTTEEKGAQGFHQPIAVSDITAKVPCFSDLLATDEADEQHKRTRELLDSGEADQQHERTRQRRRSLLVGDGRDTEDIDFATIAAQDSMDTSVLETESAANNLEQQSCFNLPKELAAGNKLPSSQNKGGTVETELLAGNNIVESLRLPGAHGRVAQKGDGQTPVTSSLLSPGLDGRQPLGMPFPPDLTFRHGAEGKEEEPRNQDTREQNGMSCTVQPQQPVDPKIASVYCNTTKNSHGNVLFLERDKSKQQEVEWEAMEGESSPMVMVDGTDPAMLTPHLNQQSEMGFITAAVPTMSQLIEDNAEYEAQAQSPAEQVRRGTTDATTAHSVAGIAMRCQSSPQTSLANWGCVNEVAASPYVESGPSGANYHIPPTMKTTDKGTVAGSDAIKEQVIDAIELVEERPVKTSDLTANRKGTNSSLSSGGEGPLAKSEISLPNYPPLKSVKELLQSFGVSFSSPGPLGLRPTNMGTRRQLNSLADHFRFFSLEQPQLAGLHEATEQADMDLNGRLTAIDDVLSKFDPAFYEYLRGATGQERESIRKIFSLVHQQCVLMAKYDWNVWRKIMENQLQQDRKQRLDLLLAESEHMQVDLARLHDLHAHIVRATEEAEARLAATQSAKSHIEGQRVKKRLYCEDLRRQSTRNKARLEESERKNHIMKEQMRTKRLLIENMQKTKAEKMALLEKKEEEVAALYAFVASRGKESKSQRPEDISAALADSIQEGLDDGANREASVISKLLAESEHMQVELARSHDLHAYIVRETAEAEAPLINNDQQSTRNNAQLEEWERKTNHITEQMKTKRLIIENIQKRKAEKMALLEEEVAPLHAFGASGGKESKLQGPEDISGALADLLQEGLDGGAKREACVISKLLGWKMVKVEALDGGKEYRVHCQHRDIVTQTFHFFGDSGMCPVKCQVQIKADVAEKANPNLGAAVLLESLVSTFEMQDAVMIAVNVPALIQEMSLRVSRLEQLLEELRTCRQRYGNTICVNCAVPGKHGGCILKLTFADIIKQVHFDLILEIESLESGGYPFGGVTHKVVMHLDGRRHQKKTTMEDIKTVLARTPLGFRYVERISQSLWQFLSST